MSPWRAAEVPRVVLVEFVIPTVPVIRSLTLTTAVTPPVATIESVDPKPSVWVRRTVIAVPTSACTRV